MQAIIMAAGKGSRLSKVTHGKPKSFVQIKGNRLIDYNIALLRHHGISPIAIVTGYCFQAFDDEFISAQDIELIYNPFYEQVNVLGSFWAGMHCLDDDFLFIHADSICDPDLFADLVVAQGDIVLPVDYDTYNEEAMGVRCVKGRVVEISKKIPIGDAEGEFIGLAKIAGRVLPQLKAETVNLLKTGAFSEYFEAALQSLIVRGIFKITLLPTKGRFWAEIDFAEDYERASLKIPDSLVRLAINRRSYGE